MHAVGKMTNGKFILDCKNSMTKGVFLTKKKHINLLNFKICMCSGGLKTEGKEVPNCKNSIKDDVFLKMK
jgi:hypothetical protein